MLCDSEHNVASLCPSNNYCFSFIVGERFERGIQDAVILESDEALVVVAQEEFDDVTQDGKRQLYVSPSVHTSWGCKSKCFTKNAPTWHETGV